MASETARRRGPGVVLAENRRLPVLRLVAVQAKARQGPKVRGDLLRGDPVAARGPMAVLKEDLVAGMIGEEVVEREAPAHRRAGALEHRVDVEGQLEHPIAMMHDHDHDAARDQVFDFLQDPLPIQLAHALQPVLGRLRLNRAGRGCG